MNIPSLFNLCLNKVYFDDKLLKKYKKEYNNIDNDYLNCKDIKSLFLVALKKDNVFLVEKIEKYIDYKKIIYDENGFDIIYSNNSHNLIEYYKYYISNITLYNVKYNYKNYCNTNLSYTFKPVYLEYYIKYCTEENILYLINNNKNYFQPNKLLSCIQYPNIKIILEHFDYPKIKKIYDCLNNGTDYEYDDFLIDLYDKNKEIIKLLNITNFDDTIPISMFELLENSGINWSEKILIKMIKNKYNVSKDLLDKIKNTRELLEISIENNYMNGIDEVIKRNKYNQFKYDKYIDIDLSKVIKFETIYYCFKNRLIKLESIFNYFYNNLSNKDKYDKKNYISNIFNEVKDEYIYEIFIIYFMIINKSFISELYLPENIKLKYKKNNFIL